MTKQPNVGTYPNNHRGLDIKQIGGSTLRTAFEDGTHAIYVFSAGMSLVYEIKIGYLAPEAVIENALSSALTSTFVVRGEQREKLVQALRLIRHEVLRNWGKENGIAL